MCVDIACAGKIYYYNYIAEGWVMLHFLTQEVQPVDESMTASLSLTHLYILYLTLFGSAFIKFHSIQFNLHKIKKKINC